MTKRWQIKNTDENEVTLLQKQLKIHPALCTVLVGRNIKTFDEAKDYFRPQMSQLHDPLLMLGMQKAVDRIIQAIQNNEKILLYGDYDVDGTTAVAVVYSFLQEIYKNNIAFYIPHRFTEGYGVSEAGINFAIANNFTLLITLDCGIKSSTLIAKAQQHNIDVIVCDHHLPDDADLPKAFAILNPKQSNCPYPFKELCGCGIGYKLICALEKTMFDEQRLCNNNLDLVATAIAADIVPIEKENRILAYYGLQKANKNPCIAIAALKQAGKLKKEFTISDLVFIVAPRVNAAGRMDDARVAVNLFLSTNINDANDLAAQLNTNNDDRKDADKQTTEEAMALMLHETNKYSTILYQPHWHKGVVGIVASRLIENNYKPTLVLTESNGKITGSVRSILGLNLFEALNQCSAYLENYGGHYFAAGVTLLPQNYEAFKNKFDEVVGNTLQASDFFPQINIDAAINLTDIQEQFYTIIHQMEPFGPQNLRPIFISKNVQDYQQQSTILKDKHIKFFITQNNFSCIKGIGFNMHEKYSIVKSGKPFDIVFTIEPTEWNGTTTLEIKVIDIKCSE